MIGIWAVRLVSVGPKLLAVQRNVWLFVVVRLPLGSPGLLKKTRRFKISKRRVALITGVTGQDGAYLAEYLLGLGYTVHGIKRRSSSFSTARIDHLYEDPHAGNVPFLLHYGDMTDSTKLIRLMQQIRPTEIYNLAAQNHVGASFERIQRVFETGLDAGDAARDLAGHEGFAADRTFVIEQDAVGGLHAVGLAVVHRDPVAVQLGDAIGRAPIKRRGFLLRDRLDQTVQFRGGGLIESGLLFHAENPSSRSTPMASALAVYSGLGNLEAKRDWGHAKDYVEGMHRILQADEPDDFVLATGEARSVREFVELAFAEVGRGIEWRGKGVDETGVDSKSGKTLVRIDPTYFRPTEVDLLVGDASKARDKLGRQPKTTFAQLVSEMVAGDLAIARRRVANGKNPV